MLGWGRVGMQTIYGSVGTCPTKIRLLGHGIAKKLTIINLIFALGSMYAYKECMFILSFKKCGNKN